MWNKQKPKYRLRLLFIFLYTNDLLQLSGLMIVALLCVTSNVNTFKTALIINTPHEKVV